MAYCFRYILFWNVLLIFLAVAANRCTALSAKKLSMGISSGSGSIADTRRALIFRSLSTFITIGGAFNLQSASALEERNEMLCGTGFFTNIAQYKCTEIGDISDEGKAKSVSEKELGSMGSLLERMGIEDAVEVSSSGTDSSQRPRGDKKSTSKDKQE